MRRRSLLEAFAALGASLLFCPLLSCDLPRSDSGAAPEANLALIQGAMQSVESNYVHPVGSDQLTTNALKGMTSRLDPHSTYLDEKEYRAYEAHLRGSFGGLGMELSEMRGVPQIVSSIDETPAARAGLEPGDMILAVNGRATAGMDIQEVGEILRGEPGSKVTLTIARGKQKPFSVTLTRKVIRVVTVKSKLEPNGIGYVRITEFADNTPSAFKTAIKGLEQRGGGQLRGLVVDLRENPGGLLDAAVAVAGHILDGGTVVTVRGRRAAGNKVYTVPKGGDLIAGVPVVVLVNSASASAAEVIAGAWQDRHRATVMGTQSFGKGSVQSLIALGRQGVLRLTTALYYTPSGHSIQGAGVSPDVVVPVAKGEQVLNAVIAHESALHGAFASEAASNPARMEQAFSPPIRPSLIGTNRDNQLSAALAFLERRTAASRAPK